MGTSSPSRELPFPLEIGTFDPLRRTKKCLRRNKMGAAMHRAQGNGAFARV